MAKKQELENRRQKITEAAWRVLARDGLGELSVRKVAAEADIAPSSLRYLFPSQQSLREHAIDLVLDNQSARIEATSATKESSSWPRSILMELLPLDEQRQIEMEAYLALGSQAITDPGLRPTYLRVHEKTRDVCARALRYLLGDHADPAEIDRLHGIIDGLSLHIIRRPTGYNAQDAVAALDVHLQQLSSG